MASERCRHVATGGASHPTWTLWIHPFHQDIQRLIYQAVQVGIGQLALDFQ
jgi:hypothetical protein